MQGIMVLYLEVYMPGFTVRSLIQHFVNRLAEMNHNAEINNLGKTPQFPAIIIFIGEESIKGFTQVATSLFEVWPPYRDELKFVGVTAKEGVNEYNELKIEDNEISKTVIKENDIIRIMNNLFSENTHFQNKNKLIVYFVLSTEDCDSGRDFLDYIDIMNEAKRMLRVEETDMTTALVVLLDESITKKVIARQIRNEIAKYYDDRNMYNSCNSIFLISNRKNNNTLLSNWGICYKIISSIIELSNNSDANITTALFSRRILTAKYAREEKPSASIGEVVVTKLLEEFAGIYIVNNVNLMDDEVQLLKRLGITKDGTINILDDFVKKSIFPELPDIHKLTLFPRKNMDTDIDISGISSQEFNDLTMDAWDSFLAKIVMDSKKKINAEQKQRWSAEYSQYLHDEFTINELIYLGDHIENIRQLFRNNNVVVQNTDALTFAKAKLRHEFSSNDELIEIFISSINEEVSKAKVLLDEWNGLLQSKQNLFGIDDNNLREFYESKVINYLDYNRTKLVIEFRNQKDIDSVEKLFEKILSDIISRDGIYLDTFEKELNSRINRDGLGEDVGQYIREKLTGNNVDTYLKVNFAFGSPVLFAIMLKFGTSLYNSFRNNLEQEIYYYNTGYGNAAESIEIYEVVKENLIN